MARPYSDDLRERVAASVAEGRSCRAVAALFRVSPASVVKWSQRFRATGSAAAKSMGGVRRAVLAGQRDWLLERIKAVPDLTLRALQAELAERGVVVSHWAVWKLFASGGITFKKSLLPSEQSRAAIAHRRDRWKKLQARLDTKRLVFVDETPDQVRGRLWAKTNMTRLHGRTPRGQRLHAKVPYGHWKTMTFIAAPRTDRIDAHCVLDQPINRISFLAWVDHFLVPTLKRGDIVIADNLGSHKNREVRRAIRAVGAKLFVLPPL